MLRLENPTKMQPNKHKIRMDLSEEEFNTTANTGVLMKKLRDIS